MKVPIRANDILAFVLEFAALAFWGLWAASLAKALVWRWLFGLLAVGVFVAIWALFFARTASWRLDMPWLLIGKLLLLLPPGLLYFRGKMAPSLIWTALVLVHLIVGAVQKGL